MFLAFFYTTFQEEKDPKIDAVEAQIKELRFRVQTLSEVAEKARNL